MLYPSQKCLQGNVGVRWQLSKRVFFDVALVLSSLIGLCALPVEKGQTQSSSGGYDKRAFMGCKHCSAFKAAIGCCAAAKEGKTAACLH